MIIDITKIIKSVSDISEYTDKNCWKQNVDQNDYKFFVHNSYLLILTEYLFTYKVKKEHPNAVKLNVFNQQ